MVSFHQLNQRKTILESNNNSKKRKWDHDLEANESLPYKQWMNHNSIVPTNIELSLETPALPSDWQRCLDIQSGEIYYYNTRTKKRTMRDPREVQIEEQTSPRDYCHMSLDLQLNLPCGSLNNNNNISSSKHSQEIKHMTKNKPQKPPRDLFKCLSNDNERKGSGLSDTTNDDRVSEMVAAACMKCHMLVVLQKSAPTCPNCKFVHPPYQTPNELFKAKLSLNC